MISCHYMLHYIFLCSAAFVKQKNTIFTVSAQKQEVQVCLTSDSQAGTMIASRSVALKPY